MGKVFFPVHVEHDIVIGIKSQGIQSKEGALRASLNRLRLKVRKSVE
jgi:hypothetical protein